MAHTIKINYNWHPCYEKAKRCNPSAQWQAVMTVKKDELVNAGAMI